MSITNTQAPAIILAVIHHFDGWRGDFIPIDESDEREDARLFWASFLTLTRADIPTLVEHLLQEAAFYAAIEPVTRERWNILNTVCYKDWAKSRPESRTFVLDAMDDRITVESVTKRLEQFVHDMA
jgi:hypothetical protein